MIRMKTEATKTPTRKIVILTPEGARLLLRILGDMFITLIWRFPAHPTFRGCRHDDYLQYEFTVKANRPGYRGSHKTFANHQLGFMSLRPEALKPQHQPAKTRRDPSLSHAETRSAN